MSRRNKLIAWLLIVAMPIAGCQTVKVSYRDANPPARTIVLAAVAELNRKHPKYVAGVTFEVYRGNEDLVAERVSSEETSLVIENLESDTYKVVVSGKGFEPHTEFIGLVEERSATLLFAVNPARAGKVINDSIGLVLGAALVVVGFVVFLWLEAHDDDDDDTDGH